MKHYANIGGARELNAELLRKLDSATRYPSIPTYHAIDPAPRKGGLLEEVQVRFGDAGDVWVTEKVDGTNARIIVLPDGEWLIGSRKELLTARGDIVSNPALGIVEALADIAEKAAPIMRGAWPTVLYLEVFGHKDTPAWKNYGNGTAQYRMFDIARVRPSVLDMTIELISSWRDRGSQEFLSEGELRYASESTFIKLTPRIAYVKALDIPMSIEGMSEYLGGDSAVTGVGTNDSGRSEGLVLRNEDRSLIAKARIEDYQRTLRNRKEGK